MTGWFEPRGVVGDGGESPAGTTRREALIRGGRLAAGAAAGLSLPALLAACDADERGPQAEAVLKTSIAVDLASYYAPFPDLKRLTLARAKAAGVQVLFSADPAGSRSQVDSVKRVTGKSGGFRVIAIGAFDPATIDPLAKAAIDAKLQIVSFLTPLEPQTGGIVIDRDAAAKVLVERAIAAARRLPSEADAGVTAFDAGVILVVPPPAPPVPDPFFPVATANAAALRKAVAASAWRKPVAIVEAVGEADARSSLQNTLMAYPEAQVILTANDVTALGTVEAMPMLRSDSQLRGGFVGALGAPAVTSRATLYALEADGPMKMVLAPRLSALAAALVDVPHALLKGGRGEVVTVPFEQFKRGAAVVRAARADYA